MAIVKMSEFTLYVLNEHVDQLLMEFQVYKDITFRDLRSEEDTLFQKSDSGYDFEKNSQLADRLKSILSSVDQYEKKKKKGKKKSGSSSLNVPSISFTDLCEKCEKIDIDFLMETYDLYHDTTKNIIEGYEIYRPWKDNKMTREAVQAFIKPTVHIGTVSSELSISLAGELRRLGNVFFMHRPHGEEQSLFIIIPTGEVEDQLEIISDKFHFQQRSASSLGIGTDVHRLQGHVSHLAERYANEEKTYADIGLFKQDIQYYYEYLRNEELRYRTKENFLASDSLTKIAGWIFTEDTARFDSLLKELTNDTYTFTIENAPIDSKDVPIKLRNKGFIKSFEGITSMYSLPRYSEMDPTALFTPFYAVFFGMMLGDVGYGLIMGIGCFLALKLLHPKESTATFIRFLMYLSIPTILCGWAYGSFLGGLIPIRGLIDINKDFMTVLIFSICFGIVHLFYGLFIKAYLLIRRRHPWLALFDVGFWLMTLSGGGILVSQMFTPLLAPYSTPGLWLLIVGMVGIFLTNGREARTIVGKAASGLYSLYGLSNYIGDVLSYSRLMALGLAGASIGVAFNMLVTMMSSSGIVGIFGAVIVFLIGHIFNMAISGLSAYVHSARLTYVEFFGKFYTGGGKRFESFRSKTTYINVL